MAGVDAHLLPRLEVEADDLAVQLDVGAALAREFLQEEAAAAEDADPELLLHVHGELDAFLATDEAVAVDNELVVAVEGELADLAGRLRCERDEATRARRVAGHEERAPTERTLRRLQETALRHSDIATGLERDVTAEPRQLARLSDDCLAIGQRHRQDRCRWPGDHSIHKSSSLAGIGKSMATVSLRRNTSSQAARPRHHRSR